jgi:hypothetical protein
MNSLIVSFRLPIEADFLKQLLSSTLSVFDPRPFEVLESSTPVFEAYLPATRRCGEQISLDSRSKTRAYWPKVLLLLVVCLSVFAISTRSNFCSKTLRTMAQNVESLPQLIVLLIWTCLNTYAVSYEHSVFVKVLSSEQQQ